MKKLYGELWFKIAFYIGFTLVFGFGALLSIVVFKAVLFYLKKRKTPPKNYMSQNLTQEKIQELLKNKVVQK